MPYLSVVEALRHAAIAHQAALDIRWVNSEDVEAHGAEKYLSGVDGVVVPGGFGTRGIIGKIQNDSICPRKADSLPGAVAWVLQCSVVEWARNVAHLERADSSEFDEETPNPVISLLPEQQDVVDLGGTMRLGFIPPCRLAPDTPPGQPVVSR